MLTLATLMASCARRFDLTPAEMARIEEAGGSGASGGREVETAGEASASAQDVTRRPRPALAKLRVYLSSRLRSYYAQQEVEVDYTVDTHKVRERGAHRPRVRRINRGAAGMIVAEDSQGDMRRLWVTFSTTCEQANCAYGFVETELDRYSLVAVPTLETYKEPRSYRRARLRRNLLRLSRQRSLSEANEVLAAVRGSKKVLTVDLQVRKDRRRPTRREGEALRGVGY